MLWPDPRWRPFRSASVRSGGRKHCKPSPLPEPVGWVSRSSTPPASIQRPERQPPGCARMDSRPPASSLSLPSSIWAQWDDRPHAAMSATNEVGIVMRGQTHSADQGPSRTSTQNIVVNGLPARPIDDYGADHPDHRPDILSGMTTLGPSRGRAPAPFDFPGALGVRLSDFGLASGSVSRSDVVQRHSGRSNFLGISQRQNARQRSRRYELSEAPRTALISYFLRQRSPRTGRPNRPPRGLRCLGPP